MKQVEFHHKWKMPCVHGKKKLLSEESGEPLQRSWHLIGIKKDPKETFQERK